MAANVPLELQSQLQSKMLHLKESLDCFRVVQQVILSQTCVGSASFQPDASSQAELGVPLPGANVFPRAEGHQAACSPVQKLSIAVVTSSAVGAAGGEAAAAASDSFHKCSLTAHDGFWMPDKKQCWTCESYTDGQIFALDLQNVLFQKLSQIGQPKQVIFLAIWSFSLQTKH